MTVEDLIDKLQTYEKSLKVMRWEYSFMEAANIERDNVFESEDDGERVIIIS